MLASVYIETLVISYVTSRPSRDLVIAARQAITAEWWHEQRLKFDVYISALVEEEISEGGTAAAALRIQAVSGIPSVKTTQAAVDLAQQLIAAKAVPVGSAEDALHIAIAATQGTEYLLTWNFKHINNAETKGRIAEVIEEAGYISPVLCSPEELGGITNDE